MVEEKYEAGIAETAVAAIGRMLRKHESTGRPLGGVPFLQRCSRLLGRDLLPGKPGRPSKQKRK